MDRRYFVTGALAAGAAPTLAIPQAGAQTLAGQSVTIVVPFGVGGGADLWARFNALFLQKYLPGKPAVIIKNSPGGGSVSGANYFVATAKPDGLTVLATSGSTQFPYLLGETRVKYDYKKLKFFLAGPTGGVAYISAKTGVDSLKSLDKVKGKKLFFASQGVTSLDLVPLLAFRLLGLDVEHVVGFPGRAEGRLGFERGEFTIDYQTTSAYLRSSLPLVKRGDATALFSWGILDKDGHHARDPNFPELPTIAEAYEIVNGKKPAGLEWDAFYAFFLSGFPAQKLLLLPGATPEPIVEMYRAAIREMRNDPEYLSKRDEMIGEYEQVTDAEGEAIYQKAINISPEARALVRDLLTKEYKTTFG